MCDFVFTIPVGPSFWPVSNFEPLIVGLYFSLLPFSPWQLRGSPFLDVMARGLSAVSRSDNNWGDILRQLGGQARNLATMPQSMARGMLLCHG
jgi:hypothetical protein